ncbi:unnamed protein product [Vicia faba]|uniref:Uncharacterized protein n=1 Tax=Vicia faba TaxID=3906 RepID=A0AAV0Z6P8_VICFA|nr:unnamed protein product [Vicia faba]
MHDREIDEADIPLPSCPLLLNKFLPEDEVSGGSQWSMVETAISSSENIDVTPQNKTCSTPTPFFSAHDFESEIVSFKRNLTCIDRRLHLSNHFKGFKPVSGDQDPTVTQGGALTRIYGLR